MKNNNEEELVKIFTGSEMDVNLISAELEEIGIPSMIKNDFLSGMSAGFASGVPSAVDLFVNESDQKKAEKFITDFLSSN